MVFGINVVYFRLFFFLIGVKICNFIMKFYNLIIIINFDVEEVSLEILEHIFVHCVICLCK